MSEDTPGNTVDTTTTSDGTLITTGTGTTDSLVYNGSSFVYNGSDLDIRVEEKASDEDWTVGASRNLKIVEWGSWDAQKARDSMFDAGFDTAKRGHLAYDRNRDDLKTGYKLPFAAIEDGELVAVKEGLRAAASRLPQTDIPDSVKEEARAVLDAYFERMDNEDKTVVSTDGVVDLYVVHNGRRIHMGKYTVDTIESKPGRLTINMTEER